MVQLVVGVRTGQSGLKMVMERIGFNRLKRFALVPVAALIALMIVVQALDIHTGELLPRLALPVLNTAFLGVIFLAGASLCARGFISTGSCQIMLTGSGLFALGMSAPVAGWLVLIDGQNVNITVFNLSALVAAAFLLLAAALSLKGAAPWKVAHRRRTVISVYCALAVFIGLVAALSALDISPAFYVAGEGATVLRQVVLGAALAMMAAAAVCFVAIYARSGSASVYWCALGLTAFSVGLFNVMVFAFFGDLMSWLGRSGQYLGGVYFLAAALAVRAEARSKGALVRELVGQFLMQSRANYEVLVETLPDAVVLVDETGRVLMWNRAAGQVFGYSRAEAVGSLLTDLVVPDSDAGIFKKHLTGVPSNPIRLIMQRKSGEYFPVEVTVSSREVARGLTTITLVMRDITQRERDRESLVHLASFPELNPLPVMELDIDGRIRYLNPATMTCFPDIVVQGTSHPFLAGWAELARALAEQEPYSLAREISAGGSWYIQTISYVPNRRCFRVYASDITESKRAEESLQEAEQNFRGLFNNRLVGLSYCRTVLDPQGKPVDYIVLDVNESYEALTGIKRENIVGKRITEATPGVEQSLIDRHNQVAMTGQEAHFETYEPATRRWYDVNVYSPSRGEFIAIFYNISERKQTEESLRETRNYLNSLLDYASAPIIVWDPGLHITLFNRAFERLTGLNAREVMGKPIDILFPGESRAESLGYIYKAAAGERWETVEVPVLRVDGAARAVLWNSANIYSAEGKLIATIAQGQDITDRKRAEKGLAAARERLQNVLDSITEGNYVLDDGWRFVEVNAAAEKHFGREAEELVGRVFWEMAKVPPGSLVYECLTEAAATGKPLNFEAESHVSPGRWLHLYLYPRAGALDVYFHDITERKRAEHLKDDFIGMVSHELKTPLTVIIGALSLLETGKVPAEQAAGLFSDAVAHAGSLSAIIENLLELSRHQAARLGISPEETNIEEVARGVAARLQGKSAAHRLTLDFPAGLPRALVDRLRLERVLYNLADNAVKFSPEGGEVRIFARRGESEVTIGVSDQGQGIPAESQGRLFQDFERLDAYITSTVPGVGLGLKVCRILVEAHGGRIWVESEAGKGATFLFTVPTAKAG